MLTARGIAVSFGALSVLHDVDLVVGAQDKIAVVGPNGVGNSNLDLPAIEQLERALDGYDGTLLIVTHDRRLAERVRVTRTVTVAAGVVTQQ